MLMADVVLRIKPATDEKKIGSSVTTITEWALLAQSYIIQLFSSLVYPFSIGTHLVLFRFAKKTLLYHDAAKRPQQNLTCCGFAWFNVLKALCAGTGGV